MYFDSGDISWFFSRSTWIVIGIAFVLALWKIIDIVIWVFSYITIVWN
jgi:hypothetical protein